MHIYTQYKYVFIVCIYMCMCNTHMHILFKVYICKTSLKPLKLYTYIVI